MDEIEYCTDKELNKKALTFFVGAKVNCIQIAYIGWGVNF